jgi:hypothetical protein
MPDDRARVVYLRSYGDRTSDDSQVVRKVLEATIELLRERQSLCLTRRHRPLFGVAHRPGSI